MRKLRKGESYGRTDRPIFTSNNIYTSPKSTCLNRLEDERLKYSKNARTSCLLPRICSKSALIAVLSGVGFREQKNRIAKVLDVVGFNAYKNMAFSRKKGLVQLSSEQCCQEPPTRNILFTSNNTYKSPKSACLNRLEDERLKHSKNALTSCLLPRICSKSALIAVLSGLGFREQKNRIAKFLDVVVFNAYKNMAFSHKKGLVQLSGEQRCQEPPTRNILDSLKPTAYSLLLIFVSMFSLSDAWAQSVEIRTAERQTEIKPLLIGQRVPEEFWTKEHLFYTEGDTVRGNLSEHKGKLLVLGFWSTTCATCLSHYAKIKEYLDMHPEEIVLVKINPLKSKDNLDRITQKMVEKGYGKSFSTIIYDDYLEKMFPGQGFPHYVWINKLGALQTVTYRNLLDADYRAPFIDRK